MIRHEYSYWLDIKPLKPETIDIARPIEALRQLELLTPDGSLYYEADATDGTVSCEVDPEKGTVPQDPDMEAAIEKLAASLPEYSIKFRALDEEDKSIQHMVCYEAGNQTRNAYARIIPCDQDYDPASIRAAVNFLAGAGHKDISELVREHFASALDQ